MAGLPGGLIIYQGNPSISPKRTPTVDGRHSAPPPKRTTHGQIKCQLKGRPFFPIHVRSPLAPRHGFRTSGRTSASTWATGRTGTGKRTTFFVLFRCCCFCWFCSFLFGGVQKATCFVPCQGLESVRLPLSVILKEIQSVIMVSHA